ncbi:MAG: alpha/beta hydrolase [Alphaproteobacteria bacterium]|nr:alpha/beta hydrolase [Alphaproteobacteria bacterium]
MSTPDLAALIARPGANDLPWQDANLPGRTILLRSARPKRITPETPILFVHHGVARNGGDYRDFWLPLVDEADVMVIAPEFSNADFPGSHWYNFGNRADSKGVEKPRAEWTYGIPGRVFAALRASGITRRSGFGQFGHSAGGQFVHRAMSLGFRDWVQAVVSANAGTYAMPTMASDFPYGLGNTGLDDATVAALLRFRLTVMAGTADVITDDPNFPKDKPAMAQGPTRYARAHAYIASARAEASRRGVECGWTIVDVAGVGHDGNRMSAAAAPILSAALHAAAL